jgi:Zn-dependent M28 family amino/carboxypeptidase
MKIYSHRAASPGSADALPPLAPGVSSVRFGSETLLYVDEEREAGRRDAAPPAASRGARLPQRHVDAPREQLHVVVQNGRLFQQHHPEVPVIHDRGRFLLVQLDPGRVGELTEGRGTCYGVMPLTENAVVFEERAPAAARAAAPAARGAVDDVDPARIETTLAKLVSFGTRHSTSRGFAGAAEWARGQLDELGYRTRAEDVAVGDGRSANLIAEKAGTARRGRRVVLVTAHLDSINLKGGPGAPAPGADDNGSGSAGLLEVARAVRGLRGRHDLRLILFGGEEQGLFGSRQYVGSLSASERARIQAVVNMDMIGRLNSETHSVLLEGGAASRALVDEVSRAAAAFTRLRVEVSFNPFASDHVPFIEAGIPALLAIEGADNTNQDVHSERDTLPTINYPFATEILRMVAGFTAQAIGPAR